MTSKKDSRKIKLAENENTSANVLEKLSNDENKSVRLAVAMNPNTPTATLDALARDDDRDDIRLAVAGNPNTSEVTLEALAKDEYEAVRLAVAENPSTPADVLDELVKSKCLSKLEREGYYIILDNISIPMPVELNSSHFPLDIGKVFEDGEDVEHIFSLRHFSDWNELMEFANKGLEIDGHSCEEVYQWKTDMASFVIGQDVEDNDFFYVEVFDATEGLEGTYTYEFDKLPSIQEVEETHIDRLSAIAIDRYEEEYGADGRRVFPNWNAPEKLAFRIADRYISIQETERGYDYSIMGADYKKMNGGIYDNLDVSIREALNNILEDLKEDPFDNGARGNISDNDELIPIDYNELMKKVDLEGVHGEKEPISIFNIRVENENRFFKNTSGLDAEGLCKAYAECNMPFVEMGKYGEWIGAADYAYIQQGDSLDFSIEFNEDTNRITIFDGENFENKGLRATLFPELAKPEDTIRTDDFDALHTIIQSAVAKFQDKYPQEEYEYPPLIEKLVSDFENRAKQMITDCLTESGDTDLENMLIDIHDLTALDAVRDIKHGEYFPIKLLGGDPHIQEEASAQSKLVISASDLKEAKAEKDIRDAAAPKQEQQRKSQDHEMA